MKKTIGNLFFVLSENATLVINSGDETHVLDLDGTDLNVLMSDEKIYLEDDSDLQTLFEKTYENVDSIVIHIGEVHMEFVYDHPQTAIFRNEVDNIFDEHQCLRVFVED